jgi:hypothetical protein
MEVGWVDRRKRRNPKYRGVSCPGSGYGWGWAGWEKREGGWEDEAFCINLRGAIMWFM